MRNVELVKYAIKEGLWKKKIGVCTLRSLRKEGFVQVEIDHLFKASYCSAKDHIRTSSLWSQPGRFKYHTTFFLKKVQ